MFYQGPNGALKVLKTLEFDCTKFKALKAFLKNLEFKWGQYIILTRLL